MNILEALDDRDLFAPHFKGGTWRAWRAFLAALFALDMDAEALETYRRHTGRSEPPAGPFDEVVCLVGRRGGKSRILATIAVFLACFKDYEEYLAPGEVATVGILAADRRQARAIFRFITGLLEAVPPLKAMIADQNAEQITLDNRVQIEISTASFRSTRGYSYAAVLGDEVCFWRSDESSANPDIEILRALRPGMASIPGSILLLASSPYAKRGEMYASFRKYFGKDEAPVLVWKAPTLAMYDTPKLRKQRDEDFEKDPESARAEWDAEFRDDLADYVTREIVDAVTCWDRHELPPEPGVAYSAFCDPSGGASDSMVMAVGHLQDNRICVVDAVLEVRAPFDPEVAVAQCAHMLRRFGITRCVGDRYAGAWPKARFQEHGITFEQSARPKSDLYHDLLPLLNARRVELLDNPKMSAQLVGLERRTARSGKDSIDHVPGGHDDIINAVAGVLVGLDLDRRPGLVKQDDLLTESEALPLPTRLMYVYATLSVSKSGISATIYMGVTHEGLRVLDYDCGPLEAQTYANAATRAVHFARHCNATYGDATGLYAPPELIRPIAVSGVNAEAIPDHLLDPESLLIPAASHIKAGFVKICLPAHEKAKTSPFGGALDFRGGDSSDDPLRRTALWAIALGLDPQ